VSKEFKTDSCKLGKFLDLHIKVYNTNLEYFYSVMEKQMNGSQTFQKHVPDLGHHNLEKKIKDIHFTVENNY